MLARCSNLCSHEFDVDYIKKNPCVTTLDVTPLMAEHEVNTDRVGHTIRGCVLVMVLTTNCTFQKGLDDTVE